MKMSDELYQLNEFVFSPQSGQLFRIDGEQLVPVARLSPQPSDLLKLLIEHCPGIVTHEQIRDALWPGVVADYEKGMHFCVRQVRAAFGDQASSPRFVETLPRRGYRIASSAEVGPWKAAASPKDEPKPTEIQSGNEPHATPRAMGLASDQRRDGKPAKALPRVLVASPMGATLTALLLLSVVVAWGWAANSERPLRIAIMSFEPSAADSGNPRHNDVAELLVEELSRTQAGRFEVVGPTSTIGYGVDGVDLVELVEAVQPDYVINGRFLTNESAGVLAEIIQASNGVHVWVEKLDQPLDADDAHLIADALYQLAK